MKKKSMKNDYLFVFVFISIVCLVFCFAKYGYFVDEVFTLGCANSHYAPFISMINQGNINNVVLERSDFLSYLTVDNNEIFDIRSVFYNLSYDTQPPLYFVLLNMCSSLFPNCFSKWIGLGLNFLLFWITLVFLYKTCRLLDVNKKYSLISVVLFGLSNSLLSNLLNIRMYILFTCLSMILVNLFVLYRKTSNKYICIIIFFVVFSGAMTQYIYLIFAFFMCVVYILYYVLNKDWIKAFVLGFAALLGVLFLLIVFPSVLKVVFSGGWSVSGGGMLEKLKSISSWPKSLISGARALVTGTFISFSLILAFLYLIIIDFRVYAKHLCLEENIDIYLIIIATILTFALVSIISPGASNLNYISNLSFIMPLMVGYLFDRLLPLNIDYSSNIIFAIKIFIIILCAISAFVVKPNYINGDFRVFDKALSQYWDFPCVYYQAKNNNAPISQDMAQLIRFENVFITDGKNNKLISDYVNAQDQSDRLAVYVDATNKNNYSANEMINFFLNEMNYSSYALLYKYECSECYVFEK